MSFSQFSAIAHRVQKTLQKWGLTELAENCPPNDTPVFWEFLREFLNGNISESSEIWRA